MRLCQVCQSISFEALPPFPKDDYYTGLTGKKRIHHFSRKPIDHPGDSTTAAAVQVMPKVRHHESIDSLREAAAGGCELCLLIQGEADAMLDELDGLGEEESRERRLYPTPSFDMWLTQRPEGGRGFWVLSEPRDSTGCKLLMPIAAFGIVVEEDNPMSNVISGRPVKATVDSEVLERLVRSITGCNQTHGCHQRAGPAPQLLLNLHASKSGSDESVKIVELGDKAQAKYASLSYASESGIARCRDTVTPSDGDEIPVANLPKTFQDAILVTRALGLQYLWIDSMCIPGSLAEWQRSSPRAAAVWANACVTISATGAIKSLEGLFFPRPELQYARITYTAETGTSGTVLVSSLPLEKEVLRTRYIEMPDEPVSSGVWYFQERVLSPRVVHFASDQIYIECMQEFVSEDGLLERMRYHNTAEDLPAGTTDYELQTRTRSPLSRWFAMIWDYGRRKASNPTDKLVALANIARAFQQMMPGDDGGYIAGHWKDSLVDSLCWQSLKCKPSGDSNAPSWSWVSVDGIPAMGFAGSIADRYYATVIGTQVELADADNPFGHLKAASITLEAPLIPMRLVEADEMSDRDRQAGWLLLRSQGAEEDIFPGLDTIDRRFAASADEMRIMSLFAVVLVRTRREEEECLGTCQSSDGTLRGLIVTPAAKGGMRRLGFFLASPEDIGPASLLDIRESFKLI